MRYGLVLLLFCGCSTVKPGYYKSKYDTSFNLGIKTDLYNFSFVQFKQKVENVKDVL